MGDAGFDRVLPNIHVLVERDRHATIFTRFVPARNLDEVGGPWLRYYHRWEGLTLEHVEPPKVDVVPELKRYTPPAAVIDKMVYSP